ncbi:MAG: hypothetical protein C4329_15235 [Chitinophagaceae bacterium]
MKREASLNLVIGLIIGIGITALFAFKETKIHQKEFTATKIEALPLSSQISFTGEAVPLDRWGCKRTFGS